MGGNTRTVSLPTDEEGFVAKILDFRPCAHPGGSDLPGTKVTFDTTLYEGDTAGPSNLNFTTLGPDETPPVLEVTSDPPPGSMVEPGQTITVSIVGRETGRGAEVGTWQTGVRQIKLTDFDTGAVLGEQIFGEQALPCAQKAWSKGLHVFYTVPEDAPAQIRLMAEAFDFAEQRGSFGLSYLTGEVWEGRVTGESVQPGCSPESVRVTGKLTLQVEADGTVTGSVTERRGSFSCGGVPVPPFVQTYPITGRKTATAFELSASGTAVTLMIAGSRATATFTHINGGYGATVIYTVDCVSCGNV